jgi:hypothetical protein
MSIRAPSSNILLTLAVHVLGRVSVVFVRRFIQPQRVQGVRMKFISSNGPQQAGIRGLRVIQQVEMSFLEWASKKFFILLYVKTHGLCSLIRLDQSCS